MAIDPNIALGVKPIELANPLAQYGMVSQIQHAQNQNRLADMQMQEYQRTRAEEEGARNFLKGRDLTASDTVSGLAQFGKTGLAYSKELSGQRKTNLETEAAQFKLANDKLKHGWQSMGEASTPQAAIEKLNDGVKNGYFDTKTATAEIAKLQSMPLEQYKQYRVEKIMGLLDAKDQLAAVSPKIARQEAGGQILNIQDNPLLPGYGLPVQGMAPITKTMTFADRNAAAQLGVSQGQLEVARQNAKTNQNRLDFDKTKDKDKASVSEQQASYNIGRVLTAANQIDTIGKKDPSAIQPGGAEALASSVGMSGTANAARNANRQIVYGAQRDALDALLYLATGAAYNKEQLEGQMAAYIPAYTDAPENVAAKQTRMTDLIKSAKARAGKAWTPEMDLAMQSLTAAPAATAPAAAPPAPKNVPSDLWNAMTPEERKLWK